MDEGEDGVGAGLGKEGATGAAGQGGAAGQAAAGGTTQGEVIDAFGTLSISDHGISRFFGPTGGSESLLLANLPTTSSHASPESIHTPESTSSHPSSLSANPSSSLTDLSMFSNAFPFTPMGHPADVQDIILTHLPSYPRALELCSSYFEQVSWIFRGVTKAQLMDDMLPVIYQQQIAPVGEDYSSPHDLALLFIIFAIGALVESDGGSSDNPKGVSKPPQNANPVNERTATGLKNAQGEHFQQIARAAITIQPVLEKPSIVTIQTLHLMSIYNAMSGSDLKSDTSMEMTWSLITLASHLSQTIGLHRDSARWGLSAKMVQRRRILFWDLFVADVWQSLNTGRPPSFSLAYIDCSFPTYDKGNEGGFGSAFEIWQFRFAAECVADVTARTLTAEAPSYATIMELDRKVREFPLPEGMASASSGDMAQSFQRCVLDHIRETVLMYIHRSFFAQAIIEHPANPLKSAYAPSFLAAYRASSTILKSIREQFNIWPNSCSRFWTMWTFAFSAAVVFGTVVTRGPRSPLAQSAMTELEQACILFSKASIYSIRATKALPILMKLSEKAHYALAAAQKDPSPMSGDKGGLLWNIKQEDTDDELSIFAGHTRFVSAKKGTDSSTTSPPHSVRFEASPTNYAATPAASESQEHLHQQHQPMDISSYYGEHQPIRTQAARTSTMIHSTEWPSGHQHEPYIPPHSGDDRMAQMQYSNYVPSERTHQHPEQRILSSSSASSQYGWSNDSRDQAHHRYSQQQELHHQPHHQPHRHHAQQHQSYVVPSQGSIELQPVESQYNSHYHNQQRHQQPQISHQQQQQQHSMYATTPAFHSQGALPPSDLSDLGLAARDSRLDERWSSFMAESGLLDGLNSYRGH
ncbi:fungal-specific transcription factor domain-containing protein [Crucibulum laeve]|uniref:Fungal-specific transcription factor domain-containing protein n=1 Tax=Crucibulum laeve TaxID=68775 RepID=A0A5C3LW00_9AGAR|nr:fungal-specific transcription factor domain-containing protein [Crucibulum laeve]